jgi:hypothetical protein
VNPPDPPIESTAGLAPGLYIVATPIGNLGDLSPRAAATMAQAAVIAAEDTRVTAKLLHHIGVRVPMLAYHDHSDDGVRRSLIARALVEPVARLDDRREAARAEVLELLARQGLTPQLRSRLAGFKSKLRSALNGVMLNRAKYTSFSRHYTAYRVLKKIADLRKADEIRRVNSQAANF